MNIPFELGLLLAWGKHVVIFDRKKYRVSSVFSDIQMWDPVIYEGSKKQLREKLSKWIHENIEQEKGKYNPIEWGIKLRMANKAMNELRSKMSDDLETVAEYIKAYISAEQYRIDKATQAKKSRFLKMIRKKN